MLNITLCPRIKRMECSIRSNGMTFAIALIKLVFCRRQLLFKIHNLLYLNQEPAVNLREVENLLDGEAGAQGVADEEDALGVGHAQFAADDVAREDVAVAIDFRADAPRLSISTESAAPDFEGTETFLERLFESSPDCHCFTDGFHLGRQGWIGLGKFFKREPGDFCHDVINARLEARGGFARDVVLEFVEQ